MAAKGRVTQSSREGKVASVIQQKAPPRQNPSGAASELELSRGDRFQAMSVWSQLPLPEQEGQNSAEDSHQRQNL